VHDSPAYHVTPVVNATLPAARNPQLNCMMKRIETLSVWNEDLEGAATVFGEPAVPIASGAASSM